MTAQLTKVKNKQPQALRRAIENTKNYVDFSDTYNITAEDHNGLDVSSMIMAQVKDGKLVLAE